MKHSLARRLMAETIGSFFLFAAVVGSGIMGAALAAGNDAVALLANALATGAMLFVLIAMLGPVSGAHFNPAVSGVMASRGAISWRAAAGYVLAQLAGGIAGVVAAHLMFGLAALQWSSTARAGPGQWLAEGIATFGLILTIIGTLRHRADWVAPAVACYIAAAYWFTSSTSFANPAITVARTLTDSFAGIAPGDAPAFIAAQLAGASLGALASHWLFDD